MYVQCLSNEGFEDQLTGGQVYTVREVGCNSYRIQTGKEKGLAWYGEHHFRVVVL